MTSAQQLASARVSAPSSLELKKPLRRCAVVSFARLCASQQRQVEKQQQQRSRAVEDCNISERQEGGHCASGWRSKQAAAVATVGRVTLECVCGRAGLDALMEMKAMFGDARPNCIILDEIDGTAGAEGQVR